jgi:hypothetical protein
MTEFSDQQDNFSLIDDQPEPETNDPILELKSGIYNLVVALLNNYIVHLGPVDAVHATTKYLDDISSHFKEAVETQTLETKDEE